LEEIQHDKLDSLEARANNSGEDENDHLQATIEGIQRQIDQLARGLAQSDDSFEFGSPLSDEIRLCMPPTDYKDPKFCKFNGEGYPRRHLQGFKDECELKISVDSRLQAKFFPHNLEGEARKWFYALPKRSVTSFRELSMLFLEQYKHNIKKEIMVSDLCAMRQGSDEKLDKFVVRFKRTWQQIKIRLTEKEVNNIFKEVVILSLQPHFIDYTHLAFSDMTHKLLEKEKVLVKLGLVKYGEYEKPKAKDKRAQSPKKDKSIHVEKKIDEKKEKKFIKFPIPPRFILKDLVTKGLLQPLPKREEDPTAERPAWYKEDRYYEYHQTKGHATNGCGILRNRTQILIEDGFYVCPDRVDETEEEHDINVIFHEEIGVAPWKSNVIVMNVNNESPKINLIEHQKGQEKDLPHSYEQLLDRQRFSYEENSKHNECKIFSYQQDEYVSQIISVGVSESNWQTRNQNCCIIECEIEDEGVIHAIDLWENDDAFLESVGARTEYPMRHEKRSHKGCSDVSKF